MGLAVLEVWGEHLMPEIPCPSCGGSGQQITPHAAFDSRGNPIIEHVITTCHTCNGNGKVQI